MPVHILLGPSGKLTGVVCCLEELAVAVTRPGYMNVPDGALRALLADPGVNVANDESDD